MNHKNKPYPLPFAIETTVGLVQPEDVITMEEKERRSLKSLVYFLCFFLLVAMTACYYGETEVAEENEPGELAVTDTLVEEEFDTPLLTINYKAWDLDDDGFLSEEEFTAGFYQTWDLNKDGRISMGEWTRVLSDYGNGIDAADWQPWDTDGDGFVERVEFDADFAGMGWYGAWDKDGDGLITEQEYTTGAYTLWDTNGDNVLDETEYVQ